ncbi:MAG: class I SAM-dependent methyltransferase [Pseudobdellovibrionaceae bacterium]
MDLASWIYSIAMMLVFTVIGMTLWGEKRARVPAAPTLPHVKREALRLLTLHSDKEKPYRIAELGCGWGGILKALAKSFPNAHVTGYEMSLWPRMLARMRCIFSGKRIDIHGSDFYEADLTQFDMIYCYLSPNHMAALKSHFETCGSGTLIVSNAFAVPEWVPTEVTTVKSLFVTIPIYLYRMP